MRDNPLLLQTFEWHTPSHPPPPDQTSSQRSHYALVTRLLPSLANLGVSSLWLPPGCKANSPSGNGYDCYDLWDLGEFDQKYARSTKWGSREELGRLMDCAGREGVECVWDAVLNHKTAGDGTEVVWGVEVDREDRRVEICAPKKIEAWLRYEFPGREREEMKYSGMKWHAAHFNGTDWDQRGQKNAIFKLIDDPATYPKPTHQQQQSSGTNAGLSGIRARLAAKFRPDTPARRPGRDWAQDVDDEHGNYDYLMFSNIDHSHPAVRQDLMSWARWMVESTGVSGFRLDAVQHFSYNFTRDWVKEVQNVSRKTRGKDAFVVGEIWTGEVRRITKWLDVVGQGTYAYDSPLLYNFSRISEDVRKGSKNADLRTIVRDSLLESRPDAAVTLVTNHDTQPGQSSFTPMLAETKVLWYAFILLREKGFPCVFWGDLYGTQGPEAEPPACLVSDGKGGQKSLLVQLIMCRRLFAYGKQKDYWDAMSCIAWTRAGVRDKPGSGCVVVISIGETAAKEEGGNWTGKSIPFGSPGEVYVDVLRRGFKDEGDMEGVRIDESGVGFFPCRGLSSAVYVRRDAEGLERFPVAFELNAGAL
ncbi:hypothetical protein LTR62_005782 [Meristemomyces frigidus]|uniref:Glycosyl hydrolase family 13 catalytic domain-containing protein n=1 Tax=Meristemomyces frigidus TaxID=1508187 RepID=A0AAN7TEY8_9PEZI|nr:hypothetical protein LTR62_005782 [Meristemomyces frigidus]